MTAVRCLSTGLFTVDRDNRITFMNPAAESMTGWSLADALGRPSGLVFRLVDGITGEPGWQPIAPSIREDRPFVLLPNTLLVRKDLTQIPIEDTVSPIHDGEGEVVGAVVIFRDIAASRELLRQVLDRAHRDPLTSLPDRTVLAQHFERSRTLGSRQGTSIALLYLDLDNFKQINDTFGHLAGDQVLQVIAQRLCAALAEGTTICRMGGDEFAVLLEQIPDLEALQQRVETLLCSVREAIYFSGTRLEVTLSLGVAFRSRMRLELQDLLRFADEAMYRAKRAGGDRAEWDCGLSEPPAAACGVPLAPLAEHAFEEEQILLHYQPIVELATGRIVGAEALTRCCRPDSTPDLPADFIGNAERSGSIVRLGQIVLRQALRDQARWRELGLKQVNMHVNVSAVELLDPSYLHCVDRILEEECYVPSCVTLELTESALLHSKSQTNLINALTERGLRMAIDDFGVGYSNLSYLRRFPISVIKIDREFMEGVPECRQHADIVKAMIAMAASLHFKVIAEGVETEAQRLFLQGLDCSRAQGFLFGRGMPAEDFLTLLQAEAIDASSNVSSAVAGTEATAAGR